MNNMTWNQFKEHIDALLKDQQISGDEEIWYIEISFPMADDDSECLSVELGDCGIRVSNL